MGPPTSTDFLSLPPQLNTAVDPAYEINVLDSDPMANYELVRTPSIYPNLNEMDLTSIQSFEQTQTLPSVLTQPPPQEPLGGPKPQLKSVKVPRHFSHHPEVGPPATEDPWGRPIQQKFSHEMKVELAWVKFARKYLQEEVDKVRFSTETPDFHQAFIRACDKLEIATSEEEIRQIRVGPTQDLSEHSILVSILKKIWLCPSTKSCEDDLPENPDAALFESFKTAPRKLVEPGPVNPKSDNCFLNFPVNITAEGHHDELHLKMLWLNDVDTQPFVNWLRKNNVVGYINATGQSIAPPKVYEDLEDEETKTRYRDAWQKAYKARGIFYEPWLQQNYISRELR
jgi:hypothetical protein